MSRKRQTESRVETRCRGEAEGERTGRAFPHVWTERDFPPGCTAEERAAWAESCAHFLAHHP